MVSFGNKKPVFINLSRQERQFILDNCEFPDERLRSIIDSATDGTLRLMEADADALKYVLCHALIDSDDRHAADFINRLLARIPFHSTTRTLLDKLMLQISLKQDHSFHFLPGNLTPEELIRFQDYSWGDAEFPLQFNHGLSLEEVTQSLFFRNTKVFLNKLIELKDQPTATAKGNLNRKFISLIFDDLEMDADCKERILKYNKVLNEDDVFPLHISRIICDCAGLITRRAQKFLVPKKHLHLLSEEKAGELYYLLFQAHFNSFNLSYLDGLPEIESLQGTFDFALYMLSVLCNEYKSIEELYDLVFLPVVLDDIEESSSEFISEDWYLTSRIIDPLVGFGLLECKYKQDKYFRRIDQVRKTALFDRFVRVNL